MVFVLATWRQDGRRHEEGDVSTLCGADWCSDSQSYGRSVDQPKSLFVTDLHDTVHAHDRSQVSDLHEAETIYQTYANVLEKFCNFSKSIYA